MNLAKWLGCMWHGHQWKLRGELEVDRREPGPPPIFIGYICEHCDLQCAHSKYASVKLPKRSGTRQALRAAWSWFRWEVLAR